MQKMLLPIKGDSMRPFLNEGDVIEVSLFPKPRAIERSDVGSIVVIRDSDEWVAHRVVDQNGSLVVKGDWSLPVATDVLAWGQLVSVNNRKMSFTSSKFIAYISGLHFISSKLKKVIFLLVKFWIK